MNDLKIMIYFILLVMAIAIPLKIKHKAKIDNNKIN